MAGNVHFKSNARQTKQKDAAFVTCSIHLRVLFASILLSVCYGFCQARPAMANYYLLKWKREKLASTTLETIRKCRKSSKVNGAWLGWWYSRLYPLNFNDYSLDVRARARPPFQLALPFFLFQIFCLSICCCCRRTDEKTHNNLLNAEDQSNCWLLSRYSSVVHHEIGSHSPVLRAHGPKTRHSQTIHSNERSGTRTGRPKQKPQSSRIC